MTKSVLKFGRRVLDAAAILTWLFATHALAFTAGHFWYEAVLSWLDSLWS